MPKFTTIATTTTTTPFADGETVDDGISKIPLPEERTLGFDSVVLLSVSTAVAFVIRAVFDSSCDCRVFDVGKGFHSTVKLVPAKVKMVNPLGFMKSKVVLLVSHELSVSVGSHQ
ncbi:hypothetical protein HanRHA438_Chr15g0712261 [Helianthus annuus]|uniref:Uncharacterized protein n=1 Tax=Helianthus annuus TaxID=4232 RepID=A0A251SQ09_HELAN|nr:hypothetical protein HanXRQr2_Chr15g0700041 [Helianthus annuus]KAJ0451697.1 hypothetical protein HanHA300_Chr15g0570491 [Helianthus annuus]KAJ0456339.1 hypothetical protein HanIR_Chr15g0761271 [Helianthus annuus]KAJ0473582.1 hypothetical protein HanHA89_Chr15g0619951 [Helianthus annuus]KAJ0649160.1 hypothetical protein HanLR1_Chr15g0581061 [Helianthus annuus]